MSAAIGKLPNEEVEISVDAETAVLDIHFLPDAARRLKAAIDAAKPDVAGDHARVSHWRAAGYRVLSARLILVLEAVRAGAFMPTAIRFSGLPIAAAEKAPLPGEIDGADAAGLSENLLVCLAAMLGEPYGLEDEGSALVSNLVPKASHRGLLTGNGADVRLGFHTENVAHRWLVPGRDLSPAGLILAGKLAPRPGPLTSVANGRMAAALLREEHYEQLARPCVRFALPIRQRRGAELVRTAPVPVLSGRRGRELVSAALYGDMTMPASPEVAEALEAFEEALAAASVGIAIEPGVAVYVPNGYTLHARDAWQPAFDADGRADRWLQRIMVTARLDAFQVCSALSERIFAMGAPGGDAAATEREIRDS